MALPGLYSHSEAELPLVPRMGHSNQVKESAFSNDSPFDGIAKLPNSYLQVNLKYFQNIPAIRGIQQISRPGNRTYMNIKRILQYSSEQN